MSGIYIQGIEMPKGCSGCPIDSDSCTLWQELPPERLRDTRATGCPLVPVLPHGRLIDEEDTVPKDGYIIADRKACIPVKDIVNAPTIIPADKECMNG